MPLIVQPEENQMVRTDVGILFLVDRIADERRALVEMVIEGWLVSDDQVAVSYTHLVLGLPLSYLIDRQGKVRAQFQGEVDLNSIEEQLKTLLNP